MSDGAKSGCLIIACGALAREFLAVRAANGWSDAQLAITCLPAIWHNRPEKIPAGVRAKIRWGKKRYAKIFVLYGDCGTGGALDAVLKEEEVERIDGPHCYDFFAGHQAFEEMMEEELGTFFLTDYIARHFDRLIWQGMGLDRHPELRDAYFGHYRRLVYLAQIDDPALTERAEKAAARLGLTFERRFTGYGEMATFMKLAAASQQQD
ncbi:DUF1638 domain-containing protein [Dongia sp.]|uniref:DUF1638 domain-containing protein n=1 Tax=Dongia sp. TaxID=1977262 RepID=UPI0035B0FCDD